MLDNHHELISALNSSLLSQGYSPVVVRNYCTYASGFLDYLVLRGVPVADVIDVQVEQYLRHAIVKFEKERGRRPSARWYKVPRFMRCCDLLTVNGRQQSSLSARPMWPDLQFATNTKSGCVRNAGWLAPASQR
jgi:hypothetical protein